MVKPDDGQERIKVWNTQTHRALAGMSAPRRENLERYLSEHPEMEIYDGQDQRDRGRSRDRDRDRDRQRQREAERDSAIAREDPSDAQGQQVEYSRSGRMRKSTQAFDPDRVKSELRHTVAQNPARPTSDERVMVWNTVTKRKSAGNNAPRRAHLDRYLKEHPEYEVYTGQDSSEKTAWSQKTKRAGGASSRTEIRGWTAAEDAQLRELVTKHGVGSWHAVSADFASSRSSDALRHRWTKLEKHGREGRERDRDRDRDRDSGASGYVDIRGWSASEDAQLMRLIKQYGVGDWTHKAGRFPTKRSPSAMRKRWSKLEGEMSGSIEDLEREIFERERLSLLSGGDEAESATYMDDDVSVDDYPEDEQGDSLSLSRCLFVSLSVSPSLLSSLCVCVCARVCVCACACVCGRARARARACVCCLASASERAFVRPGVCL